MLRVRHDGIHICVWPRRSWQATPVIRRKAKSSGWLNKLYYGDNLEVLREHLADESVDLVYLDPPFNSNRSYNVLFKEKSGRDAQAQIEAFDDTWTWSQESETLFVEMVGGSVPLRVQDALESMRERTVQKSEKPSPPQI